MKDIVNSSLQARLQEAIDSIRNEMGDSFSLERINLAELERLTGISRNRLRRLKANAFAVKPHGNKGRRANKTVLTGYTGMLDGLLQNGVSNSAVCFERLKEAGFTGGLTAVKTYIKEHADLLPAKRQTVVPQGNRGRRYTTKPGETYQMDWGFIRTEDYTGSTFTVACFVMVCHHCGLRYMEFFPNAKQENLFIGMLHAFRYIDVPEYVLTDNMKSVVIRRDATGAPLWHNEYEVFMSTIGFKTKLCKPRHPYTKGKVERLVRFIKDNFLPGRVFHNITDMNRQAFEWCERQNNLYHRAVNGVSWDMHKARCASNLKPLLDGEAVNHYLCPLRKISFDGFVNYEGRRFGVPYYYTRKLVRIMRQDDKVFIYSDDFKELILTHDVTWSKHDSFCKDQYATKAQPEEHPSTPVTAKLKLSAPPKEHDSFAKFDFSKEVQWDE